MQNLKLHSDEQLLELLRENDSMAEMAFTEIYNRYAKGVNTYILSILRNRAISEDIFQDAFIRFYNAAKKNASITNVRSYIIRIARNLCLDHKKQVVNTIPLEDFEIGFNDSSKYENKELFELIVSAVELLDDKYKDVFVLREFDGLSYDEIAEICGITLVNAKSRGLRAKQKIIEILNPYLIELNQS